MRPPTMVNSKLLDVILLTNVPVAAISALVSDEFVNEFRTNRPERTTVVWNSFVDII